MDSVRVCMRVYAMQVCMHRRAGAMRKCDACRYCALCRYLCAGTMRYAGRAGGTECRCNVGAMQICAGANMGVVCTILMKNGRRSLQNRGVSVILYDWFRKCFVNCKFTFYITLSSYLKKVKIPKTRKNHSKM